MIYLGWNQSLNGKSIKVSENVFGSYIVVRVKHGMIRACVNFQSFKIIVIELRDHLMIPHRL